MSQPNAIFSFADLFLSFSQALIFVVCVFPLLIGLACIDKFSRPYFPSHGLCNVFSSRDIDVSRHDIFCHCSCFVLVPSRRSFADWFGVHGFVLSLFLRVVPLLIGSTCII